MKKLLHTICWALISVLYAQSDYANNQCINWYDEKLQEKIEFSIYSNPLSNSLEIYLNLSCMPDDNLNIYISEANGRLIYQLDVKDCYLNWHTYTCHLSPLNLSSGLYIITFVYKQNPISRILVLI
ncbi:MAG: hypothetical protein QXF12_04230 [Candidatus Aenigmatarchaeota archaeon]